MLLRETGEINFVFFRKKNDKTFRNPTYYIYKKFEDKEVSMYGNSIMLALVLNR